MSQYQPLGGKIFTPTFVILSILSLIAFILLAERFIFGLGAVTNINNGYPWGIWVAVDVVIGTAFGCGGFVMAFLVYILNRGEYHPLVRPALMASLFGYTLGGLAVMFDLGRYWQIYNVFLPWYAQPNSVMFEVALCVTAYIIVLWIEFTPVFLEKLKITRLQEKLNKVLFFFVALGVLLPTMHQSSLGTLMVIFGYKLSPLWNTQLLPVLFLTSAIIMGYAIVSFEAILSSAGFRRPYDTAILHKLSAIMWGLLLAFLIFRVVDLTWRSAWGFTVAGDLNSLMFWIEMLLFVFPVILFANPKNRRHPRWLFLGSMSMLLAGTIFRLNTYLIGFEPGGGWHYFPSIKEILVTVGIFAFEIWLYLLFVKTLPVLHQVKQTQSQTQQQAVA